MSELSDDQVTQILAYIDVIVQSADFTNPEAAELSWAVQMIILNGIENCSEEFHGRLEANKVIATLSLKKA